MIQIDLDYCPHVHRLSPLARESMEDERRGQQEKGLTGFSSD